MNHDIDAGFTYRYAHVLDIQNFVNEPVSVFDLSQSPNTWMFPGLGAGRRRTRFPTMLPSIIRSGGFRDVFRDPRAQWISISGFLNGTVDSNLQDAAIFLEHRMQFSPQWSVLYGLRGDLVQLNESDPLGGPDYGAPPGLLSIARKCTHQLVWLVQRQHQRGVQPVLACLHVLDLQQSAIRPSHRQ